ncbi:phosphoglycerate kinase [Stenotrophomonas phage vB_SmaS_DLP_5]|uniref:Phosphoglycerate kinase n=1 Tax=Stenotrophomonas phage vB_SmaS_DLP_5 TaxID=2044561 RepID=A0A2D2W2H0_9CAUD|nr:phosphoglycerate kinase [Stenotrophomonas phage vB_SmaS_DLP_5]ATS92341.1 phosphoglycerate kinase [Stenotrophomonas phage vB_SmaS_DLP_5]
MSKYRPSFRQVRAHCWHPTNDPRPEVRPLTVMENWFSAPKVDGVPRDMLGMLVVGNTKKVVKPGDFLIFDEDRITVMDHEAFRSMFVKVTMDLDLQNAVDGLRQMAGGCTPEERQLLEDAVAGLYMQAELIRKLHAERADRELDFLPKVK